MAYAARLDDQSHRVFCLLGDGECDEGSVWEAILFAAHHRLDNLAAIVDCNRIQGIAQVSEVIRMAPFREKWAAFGWSVREVDGHSYGDLTEAVTQVPFVKGQPSCILAHTIKGKGVSFMENTILWHYRVPRGAEFRDALAELEACQ
jgi:transketolase